MKRISTQITFSYQVLWPIFSVFALIIIIKMTFTYPALIILGLIYIVVLIWITPIFMKLKNVWLDNDILIVSDITGNKTTINKKDITEVSQNATMITPRLIKITFKSEAETQQFIRFIPTGGYWIFWQHEIVEKLNNWRFK